MSPIPEAGPPLGPPLALTVALEGGGSHGAFTWGVLDRVLDEDDLAIRVASGASAGAMNAAMLVQGLATGGRAEAKRLLETFWRRVAVAAFSPDLPPLLADLIAPATGWIHRTAGTALRLGMAAGRPGANPLQTVLDGLLDPSCFGRPGMPSLVVSATSVRTGAARLFHDREVTTQVLLASACLPQFFAAVEIDGERYWDGGYSSNPPLRALIEGGAPPDVLLVRTTPLERPDPPSGIGCIREREAEISFAAALRQELRSLGLARDHLCGVPHLPAPLARLCAARLHMVSDDEGFRALRAFSRLEADWSFLLALRRLGAAAAERFLTANRRHLGRRGTLDLSAFAGHGFVLPPPAPVGTRISP